MLRKLLITGAAGIALLLLTFIGIALVDPDYRPAPDISVSKARDVVARGDYLANNVLGCVECHSKRDWTKYAGPAVKPLGAGGPCLSEKDGLPGYVCMANITADRNTGLGKWTDGEIYRAIREGVNDQNKALFPLMPYKAYRTLSDADTEALVAYLRTLPAHENFVPRAHFKFPINILLDFQPEPLETPVPAPASDPVVYGKYLSTVAGCLHCHTPVDATDTPDPERLYAGGHRFVGPWGDVVSPNLTPADTGIKNLSREAFIGRFKAFDWPDTKGIPVEEGKNTVMPWLTYAGMTPEDLGAIYDYLMTLTPIASDHSAQSMTRDVITKFDQASPEVRTEPENIGEPSPTEAAEPPPEEQGGTEAPTSNDADDY